MRTIVKIKGLSLNDIASKQITIDDLFTLAKEKVDQNDKECRKIAVNQVQFKSDKKSQLIITHYFDKFFRVTTDKLVLDGDKTFPIGYKIMNK